ncbi:TetR/AcrR family transcriptional regulator [Agaribacter flavus]|uniref:TetR/AcrR family transcriptional regulator n=1 Tax=Agaribacter flavus TaxID=1902781 RepID=A0ABV7FLR8_9ALTE
MSPRVLDEQSLLAREQMIIEAALNIIEREGVENFTMDKVVASVPFSKGTVYKHFNGKEDVILAINNQSLVILCDFFARAAKYEGSPRERMLLVNFSYLMYSLLHPVLFTVELCARSPSVLERCAQTRIDTFEAKQTTLLLIIGGIIQEAVDKQHFKMPETMGVEQVCFSNWSMAYGIISLLSQQDEKCDVRAGLKVERELFNNNNFLLDGMQWLPLSGDRDYKKEVVKALETIFPEELAKLAQAGLRLDL